MVKPAGPIVSTSALARHLGLSRWTISRVLNGHSEVHPDTCRRVREAMDRLGFVPSPAGRALRGARTGMVGICFQALGSPIVARKIAVLMRILRAEGCRALCELTDGNPELELEVVRHFLALKVDALVLVGGLTEANADRLVGLLQQREASVVLIDPLRRHELPTVTLDREQGMRLALEHLLDLGHDRFALFGIDENVLYGRDRWQGIRRLAAERRLALDAQVVTLAENEPAALDFDYGRRLAERFLQLPDRPTAAVALNDQVAIGAMSRLQQAGLAVPRDLSIVGFDNLDVSAHVSPRLTTIDQRVDELMQTAVAMLDVRPPGNSHGGGTTAAPAATPQLHRAVVPGLVPRESTAAPGSPGHR